jgi:hypothetical protein
MMDPFLLAAPVLLLAVFALVRFVGCVGNDASISSNPRASDPTFTPPPPGPYNAPQPVGLATTSIGAAIYYTLDGSDPVDSPTHQQFFGKFPLDAPTTVKAFAGGHDFENSNVVTGEYVVNPAAPAIPPTYASGFEVDPAMTTDTRVATQAFPDGSVIPGNLMVVWIWYEPAADEVIDKVYDSTGKEYALAIGPTQHPPLTGRSAIYYTRLESAAPSFRVFAEFSAPFPGNKRISAYQYKLVPSWEKREAKDGTGDSDHPICGPVPVQINELVFAVALLEQSGSAEAPFTSRSIADGNVVEDRFTVAPDAALMATFKSKNDAVQGWITQMVTFR